MTIYIDGNKADTDSRTEVSISLGIASFTQIETSRTGYSQSIRIPMTTRNRTIMGDVEQINSPAKFNGEDHVARVEAEGCVVMEGSVFLLSGNPSEIYGNEGGYYTIAIIGPGKNWVKYAAELPLRSIPINFTREITPATIQQSWSWDEPVRFLPVQRDKFAVANTASNLFPPVKMLTFEDYHPFLHVRSMLTEIFKGVGYTVNSEFMALEDFGKLYMSGNYPKKDTSALVGKMDFKAGRFDSATTTADSMGRIYADPYRGGNSVGNIVDTADPEESRNGAKVEGVFSKGDYLYMEDERIVFRPPHEMTMAFEYSIFYTTGYYMESRGRLKGIDQVYLDDGRLRQYTLANRNIDRRGEIRTGRSYMVIVFGHENGDSYQLRYDETAGGASSVKTAATFSSRTAGVTLEGQNGIGNPQLLVKAAGAGSYVPYEKDWAIYDGYARERGSVEVELTVRSGAERILPSQPKYFDVIRFGGAEAGTAFTLGKSTTVRPIFAEYPAEGTTVGFEQLAAHDANCLNLINALKQMFNLRFYTDHLTKTVYIEPHDKFYRDGPVIDWSAKIDLSKPVTVSEPGDDMAQNIYFEYQTGDGAVSRWNVANGQKMGQWLMRNRNRLGKDSASAYTNPLFTASINAAGDYPDAPSAQLLQAGDRDASTSEKSENLNFPAKIVRYEGMAPLPDGERWGWPSEGASAYPFVAFHRTGTGEADDQGFSLCFEDRDGVAGLHSHWDHNAALCNDSKRVELYIILGPEDVEPIIYPAPRGADFRALFRLTVDGENALYRLERICDYNPSKAASTKCVFIKEI